MSPRRVFWLLERLASNDPRAIAQAHRLQAAAGGFAGAAIGLAFAFILLPALARVLELAGYGWR
ncbi:hypothetical protein [Novosphingobium sp. RL4]|uniref:hypothetical protein n=1 Tax=Novosphingobium sp. RL4 TaxID=3109595 RepID=UPI002D78D034|nr:hypothetical protein [Novosphingobium sp. RL4]WRT91342.1 hypothetical protein U9J33_08865 [Novosphingobium sp. RL4]